MATALSFQNVYLQINSILKIVRWWRCAGVLSLRLTDSWVQSLASQTKNATSLGRSLSQPPFEPPHKKNTSESSAMMDVDSENLRLLKILFSCSEIILFYSV